MPRGAEVSPLVKWTLFTFNLLVLLCGIAALVVGVYGRLVQNDFDDVANISTDPAIILIASGVVCTILGTCGTAGALRENVMLLKIYYYGITILILLEIAGGVLAFVFQEELRNEASDKMLEGIMMYRTTNMQTNLDDAVETIQKSLCCCGARGPRDWIQNNLYHNCTRETFRQVISACGVPPSCCRNDTANTQCGYRVYPFPGMTSEEEMQYPSIARGADETIYTDGCNDALYRWIVSNYAVLGGIAGGILLLQVITIFMAISMKDSIESILLQYGYDSNVNKRVV
ncbi:tetraspanin-33-like [Sycon ciliatum]|uniref:tetraspanin-33-like n=1 Tax=Sycon ciliatum TaxID=27933 RepID=UPI0031F6FADE